MRGPWIPRSLVPWFPGSLRPWVPELQELRDPVTQGLWDLSPLVPVFPGSLDLFVVLFDILFQWRAMWLICVSKYVSISLGLWLYVLLGLWVPERRII